MSDLLDPTIDKYLDRLIPAPAAEWSAMEREGRRQGLPLIDRQVGRLLELLVRTSGAARVLEIGTCIGYSTAWLARAVGENGRVLSLEIDPDRAARAREHLRAAGLIDRVEVREGDAAALIETLEGPFDLVFNDGDKRHYPRIAARCHDLLRVGGLLVSDNALWGGSAARAGGDADTKAIKKHNSWLMRHADFTATLLPVRDGVLVARRNDRENSR
ncbi:MAG: O-methyltransferase [Planctomycetota bacterium JB042]